MGNILINLLTLLPELKKLFCATTEADFDAALELHFEACVRRMEAEAHHLAGDSEEKLSAFLAASLSGFGLEAVREAYSNGRVDITIKNESGLRPQQRLAEAKIYDGYAYHVGAMEQLLCRYATGRENTGYVIEYVKKKGIATLVQKLRKESDANLPVDQQGATQNHAMKWAYVSRHNHSSEEVMRLVHININLFQK